MFRLEPPVISNEPASPPAPIPYVGFWLSRYWFCADMVPTIPGTSSMLTEVLSSTMYQLPRFCSKSKAVLNMFSMSVTLETSHAEMSPLKERALLNM